MIASRLDERRRELAERRTTTDPARCRFSRGARGTFPIRVVARTDASYPYATGSSRAVRVQVR